jgi:nitrate/nitrite transport system permease protein
MNTRAISLPVPSTSLIHRGILRMKRFNRPHLPRWAFSPLSWLRALILPMLGMLAFLLFWQLGASQINTSLGQFPGPMETAREAQGLYQEFLQEREKAAAFQARQEERHAALLAENPAAEVKIRPYSGRPTFLNQIGTSLMTVMSGFLLASLIAVPLGVLIGLSGGLYASVNPLIQLMKPVSPLAWLPLVTLVVSATYVSEDPLFAKSYLVSTITVMMCSLWPALINTAVGVAGVDKDLVNVSRVLQLGWATHVRKIVLPSAVPMIFTGLRLSLGVAWMVLIAAEMLSQNPGLGKFVWDEFQNGNSQSLGRIMVAVLTIGLIGFILDRGMLLLQRYLSWDKSAITR